MKKIILVILMLVISIMIFIPGCIEQLKIPEKYIGTLKTVDYTSKDKTISCKIWILETDEETLYLTKNKDFICISEDLLEYSKGDQVSITGYIHSIPSSSNDESYKSLEIKTITKISTESASTVTYIGGGSGRTYTAGTGLKLIGSTFSLNTNIFNQNLSWDGTYINASGIINPFNQDLNSSDSFQGDVITASAFVGDGGNLTNVSASHNMFDQDLNSSDSPTFDDITLTSYSDLDKDSTDDITLDTGNITYSHNDTWIKNSNGKYWSASDDNLGLAINDTLASNGGTIWLPEGTIFMDFELFNGDGTDVHIVGVGKNATFLKKGAGAPNYLIDITNSCNWSISDLTLDNNNTGSHVLYSGLNENYLVDNINVVNGTFYFTTDNYGIVSNIDINYGSQALQPIGCNGIDNTTFENIFINYGNFNNQAVDFNSGCTYINVNNLHLKDGGKGIKITGSAGYVSHHLNFNNLVIGDSSYVLNQFIISEYVHDVNINNVNSKEMCIRVQSSAYNVNINNWITDNATDDALLLEGYNIIVNNFQVYGTLTSTDKGFVINGHNTTIMNSIFNNCWDACECAGAEDFKIIGCTISQNYEPTSAGLYITNCNHFLVSDNTIRNNWAGGIYIGNAGGVCHNFSIDDNLIFDNTNGGAAQHGIYVISAASDFYKITDNIISGHATNLEDNGTGSTKDVSDNLGAS